MREGRSKGNPLLLYFGVLTSQVTGAVCPLSMAMITDYMGVHPENAALLSTNFTVGLGTVPIWWLSPHTI